MAYFCITVFGFELWMSIAGSSVISLYHLVLLITVGVFCTYLLTLSGAEHLYICHYVIQHCVSSYNTGIICISLGAVINAISFQTSSVIGLSPDAPLTSKTWSTRTKMILLLAQGRIKRIMLQVNMILIPRFSAAVTPGGERQEENKEEEIHQLWDGESEFWDKERTSRCAHTPSLLCFSIHQEVSTKWISGGSSALLDVFVPLSLTEQTIQTMNSNSWWKILVTTSRLDIQVLSNAVSSYWSWWMFIVLLLLKSFGCMWWLCN